MLISCTSVGAKDWSCKKNRSRGNQHAAAVGCPDLKHPDGPLNNPADGRIAKSNMQEASKRYAPTPILSQ